MYCGPGGLALGAKLANQLGQRLGVTFKASWATDWDINSCETYKANIGDDVNVIHSNIRELQIDTLDYVDGLIYGFPCNDFSLVGETKGIRGNYGPLYKYGVDFITHRNPIFFVAENVSGLSSANSGEAFKTIKDELRNAGKYGYTLSSHLYKFEQYGVPQARHRFIIVGIRSDLNLSFKVPAPSLHIQTCKDALENPPIPADAKNQEKTRQSQQVIDRLSHIKPGFNAWNSDIPDHLQLKVKGAKLSQIYRRLDPTKPSYTITGSGGGGTHVYHWSENRALTNRERARLQTFPDNFVFSGGKESVRKQIGMAVPPQGARIILEALLRTFVGSEYQSIQASDEGL